MELVYTFGNMEEVAQKVVNLLADSKIVLFNGSMGAGKTTFIHAVCKILGVTGNISSPTFSIIHEYAGALNQVVYHIDLYRLNDEQEAINAGVEDCIFSGEFCFIEWPGIILNLLPSSFIEVEIIVIDELTRKLIAKVQS